MAKYDDSCSALAVALSAGIPVLLWGGPGVGKTSVVEQIAAHHGWHLETVIASICDPTDFKGMPRDAGDRTVFSPPEWAMRTAEAGGGRRLPRRDLHRSPVRPGGPAAPGPHRHRRRSRAARRHALRRRREPAEPGRRRLGPLGAARQPVRPPRRGRCPAHVISDGVRLRVRVDHGARCRRGGGRRGRRRRRCDPSGRSLPARSDLVPPDARCARPSAAWPGPARARGRRALDCSATPPPPTPRRESGRSCSPARSGLSAAREYLAWERALDLPDVEAALAAGGTIDLPAHPRQDRRGVRLARRRGPGRPHRRSAARPPSTACSWPSRTPVTSTSRRWRCAASPSPCARPAPCCPPQAVRHFGGLFCEDGPLKAAA